MTKGYHSGKRKNTTRLPTHLSNGKKTCCWYHLEGHDTRGPRRAREPHHNNPDTTPRTWREKGELFTYASEDEHGQHYRSCATEWVWREDEDRPPYKRPKAILEANPKNQLNYQPSQKPLLEMPTDPPCHAPRPPRSPPVQQQRWTSIS